MNWYREFQNKNVVNLATHSHFHLNKKEESLTFKMIFNGQQCFKFKDKELKLFPDSFLLLAPGTAYTSCVSCSNPVKTLSISISSDFLNAFKLQNNLSDYFLDSGLFQSLYPLTGDMYFNLKNMYHCIELAERNELLWNEYINHCLKIYCANYVTHSEKSATKLNFVKADTKTEVFKRVSLAKEFISNQYNKKFSLDDVASASFLSVNHLLRTFKQAFGVSPYQYLTIIRLNRAKRLLETDVFAIHEIVLMVGFESTSSFIKAFKAQFNITPLQYRKSFSWV